MTFKEIPASSKSLNQRKLVYGVGINDAKYMVEQTLNKKRLRCPYYVRWNSMLKRCYSESSHLQRPTYKDCTVCNEWLTFSNFKSWMEKQDWKGKHLDKDILIQENKVYSPETCIFVTQDINLLLADNKNSRGKYPIGVYLDKDNGRFVSQIKINGKRKWLGRFDTPDLAVKAYMLAKYKNIHDVALNQQEPLKSALLRFVIK